MSEVFESAMSLQHRLENLRAEHQVLDSTINIAWNELPLDYLDQWSKKVEALTVADVRAAMARKLQPERMVTVVVGGKP